jgi:hypothetical protein
MKTDSQAQLEEEDFELNVKKDNYSDSIKSETNNSIFFVPEYVCLLPEYCFCADAKNFTLRSLLGGLLFGSLLCFSNMYFGLQTGWVTMGYARSLSSVTLA